MNLLEETKECLEEHNKTLYDIVWIGSRKYYIDIDKFINIADTEYDNSYGSPEVAENLLIVGENWWLERHEYDGSEWWEYKEIPIKPKNKIELQALTVYQARKLDYDVSCGWESLERINNIREEK